MAKTPAFTTATACSKALTGVGATIAAGNHLCTGMTAAFPMPNTKSASNKPISGSFNLPARMPPVVKSTVPATVYVQIIAGKNKPMDVLSKTPK